MISVDQAFRLIRDNVRAMPLQTIPLAESVGRILSRAVCSDVDSPPHEKSVMDGFAIRSQDAKAGDVELAVVETIVAGDWPERSLGPGQAARIMTGAPLPPAADAVVMIEKTQTRDQGDLQWVQFSSSDVSAGKHIMKTAANFSAGEKIYSAGEKIRPLDIGLLAEIGCANIETFRLPTVAVLPTGDELVRCQHQPDRGQIRNSNGPMLVALAESMGLCVTDLGIGRDDPVQLSELIRLGLEQDVLILSGGVSAGMLDLVPGLLREHGVREVFHKVAMKPGKPVWFGVADRGEEQTVVFGLPGNPVSSLVGFHLFVRTALRLMSGESDVQPVSIQGTLAKPHHTRGDRPTYWPGRIVTDSGAHRQIAPLVWNGSSDLRALGKADGLIHFAADSHEHAAGDGVRFFPI